VAETLLYEAGYRYDQMHRTIVRMVG